MNQTIGKILKWRGIHFLATRFGPKRLRSLAFDGKFCGGDWDFQNDGPDYLACLVKEHAKGGGVLIMGCGGASIIEDLKAAEFDSIVGIDISSEAIRRAGRYAAPNVTFKQADMVGFECTGSFSVILFS